jgi:hypothetical protein
MSPKNSSREELGQLLGGIGGLNASKLDQLHINQDPALCVIHDVFSYTGAYIIRVPGGGTKLAVSIETVSTMPIGARPIGHYQIGDLVYCIFPHRNDLGFIVGSVPLQALDVRFIIPDMLVMRSRTGFIEDPMHYQPYDAQDNQMGNFCASRPVDSLSGDKGFINELGVALWMGKTIAQLRASDIAKIEAFWGDDLLRIFGYNMELFTGGREHYSFDDQGEYSEVERSTPFPWESMGAFTPQQPTNIFDGEAGGLKQGNENARYEPKEDMQAMVFRSQVMRGYLGDGEREQVVISPIDPPDVNTPDMDQNWRGLLEIHKGLDGRFSVRSAKEIVLEKSVVIPVPVQRKVPDAPDGDTDQNYKASNQFGEGPDQSKPRFEWPNDDENATVRPTTLFEYATYIMGKAGLQTVDAHANDWEAPQDSELEIAEGVPNTIDVPTLFKQLKFTYAADLPAYGTIVVDQRDEHEVRYYRSKAGLYMLDDGSVSIEDGYGSSIYMSGGNIVFSCQGDVSVRAGRSFIAWAARDVIARAGWSAEVSAAKADVRVKAEKNLHMLAGNDGTNGSLLMECRAKSRPGKADWDSKYGTDVEGGGIIIKADDSFIELWGSNIYGGVPKDEAGRISLSAGTGPATISGGTVNAEAISQFSALVGTDRGDTNEPGQFNLTAASAKLRAGLDVVGDLGIWPGSKGSGRVQVGDSLFVKGSTFMEGACVANQHFVSEDGGDVGSGAEFEFDPNPDSEGAEVESALNEVKTETFQEFENETFESPDGQLNRDLWDIVGFSFRTSEDQYKIDETFKVPEARWQQFYRAQSIDTTWDEPIVAAPDGTPTMPHPGHDAWTGDSHYQYLNPASAKNFDYAAGHPKPRDDQKASAAIAGASLRDQYLINVQEG